jgi:hypothetical protein
MRRVLEGEEIPFETWSTSEDREKKKKKKHHSKETTKDQNDSVSWIMKMIVDPEIMSPRAKRVVVNSSIVSLTSSSSTSSPNPDTKK